MAAKDQGTLLAFASRAADVTIRARVWEPDAADFATPRGIVQIVHGMSEHTARYAEFANYLTARGFAVCADDHIGHGLSAERAEDLGHIPLAAGKEALIADEDTLRHLMQERFGSHVPYFLFGHSMGSFITRAYLARHADGLAGAVLCGTGQQPRALSAAGNALARLVARVKGERHRSAFIDGLGAGGYGKRIPNARTPLDWLATDDAVVDAYQADPLCGAVFTVGGYAALTDLTGEVAAPAHAAKIPADLPLLFIAGSEDPVGDAGVGVKAAADALRTAGVRQVEVILYPGMRHEILNEPDRATVYADVERWLEDRLAAILA